MFRNLSSQTVQRTARGTGTKNTLGHTVPSLGIRPARYASAGLNDGFSYPVPPSVRTYTHSKTTDLGKIWVA